jgi:HEAT repeat protein
MQLKREEAESLVLEKEKERDDIIRKLLDADENDPLYYHAIFNNGKVGNEEIAQTISQMVLNKFKR